MRKAVPIAGAFLLSLIVVGSTYSIPKTTYKPFIDTKFTPITTPGIIIDTMPTPEINRTKPTIPKVDTEAKVEVKSSQTGWKYDPEVSWYGPGFYGNRTACGQAYTKSILGVAHRTLPCGTKVSFRYKGKIITVPVIDRGPYVAGRQFDLSGGLCVYLNHCFTGPIYYRIEKK